MTVPRGAGDDSRITLGRRSTRGAVSYLCHFWLPSLPLDKSYLDG